MKKLHIAAGILAGTLLLTALAGCTGKDPSVDTDTSWEAETSLSSTDRRETSDTTETQTETVTTVPEADHPESSVPQETQSDPGPTETEETERPDPPLVTPPEESQPETQEMDYRVLYRQAWDAAMRRESGSQEITLAAVMLTCKDDIAERLAAELLEPLGITKEYYQALSISEVSCTAQIEKGALKNISCELNCMAELIDAATGQTVSASFAFAMETAYSLPGEAVNLVPPDDLDSYRSAEELV